MAFKDHDRFKVNEPYYNGYRLLSTPDKNGQKPEIFISSTNRSAGKTIFFNGYGVHKYITEGKKFLLLYRNKYEVDKAADNFFAQIGELFYPGLSMVQSKGIKNVFDRIYLMDDADETSLELCGYATSLRASEQIKKYSSLLADVDLVIFDEVFPENDAYLPNEVQKLISVHDSLARGHGKQARYLPMILIGNLINVFNPYYETLGVVDTLKLETNFMRGDGWVIEQGFNAASADAHKESAFHKALSANDYVSASQEKKYLNTSYQFIDNTLVDCGIYICTIVYNKKEYSVRYNEQFDFYFCGTQPDPSCKLKHAATEEDISENAIFDPEARYRKVLRKRYRINKLRFKNLEVRNAMMHFMLGK